MEPKKSFEIGRQTIWRVFIFVALVFLFYFARQALGVLAIAIVISLGLEPLVNFLENRRIPRLFSVILIFFLGLLIFATVIYFVVPIVILEIGGFLEHFNRSFLSIFGIGLPQTLLKDLSLSLGKILGFLTASNISVTGAIGAVFGKTVLVFSTIIISFYLTVERDGTGRLLRVVLPDIYEKSVLRIFENFKIKIRRWFVAQLGLSLIIGAVVTFGLWLLGVKYFLILGLMAAVFEIVPIIGPVLAGAVAFLVAISDSFTLGLYALLFFIIVQQLENHILIPVIIGKTMKVHPVVVLISLLAGGQVAGFIGVVLAVPIAVMAQEIFSYLAEKKDERRGLGLQI
ncbi:MAG: AI-2E family transporter [Patescibacteria group bacterium]